MAMRELLESMDAIGEIGTTDFTQKNADERYGPQTTETDSGWGDEMIEDLKLIVTDAEQFSSLEEVISAITDVIDTYAESDDIVREESDQPSDQDIRETIITAVAEEYLDPEIVVSWTMTYMSSEAVTDMLEKNGELEKFYDADFEDDQYR